jgi:hypothetical protein
MTSPPKQDALCDPRAGWALAVAGVVAIVGSVTPWSQAPFGISVNGLDGDGQITLACAILAAGMGVLIGLRRGWLWTPLVGAAAAALSTLVAAIDLGNMHGGIHAAYGIWLVLVGSVLAVASGIVALVRRR